MGVTLGHKRRAARVTRPLVDSEEVDRADAPTRASAAEPARRWARHPRLIQVTAVVALALGLAYLTWRIGWTWTDAEPGLFVVLVAAEIFGWISLAGYAFLAWSVPTTHRPPPLRDVTIDVFVCTYDEPVRVVEATLAGCAAIPVTCNNAADRQ